MVEGKLKREHPLLRQVDVELFEIMPKSHILPERGK